MERDPAVSSSLSRLRTTMIVLVGLIQVGTGLVVRFVGPGVPWRVVVSTLLIFSGAALSAIGLLGLGFAVTTSRSFEWFIAWRYLRDRGGSRSWVTVAVGGIFAVLAGGLYLASRYWPGLKLDELMLGPSPVQRGLQLAALIGALLAYVVLVFGFLLLSFSLFTSISMFGVFLGTTALIVVLSVMGGFENDLRQKILGTNAHIVITKPNQIFADYREVMKELSRQKAIVAHSPVLESEVMITSQTNLSGVLLKGIDPALIGTVTDLPKYLRAESGSGSLNDLLHPDRLARIPEARFRPMNSGPLGEPPDFDEDSRDDKETSKRKGEIPEKKGKAQGDRPGANAAYGEKNEKVVNDAGSTNDLNPAKLATDARGPGAEAEEEDDPEAEAERLRAAELKARARRDRLERLIREAESEIGKKIPPRPVYPGIIIGAELAKTLRVYVGDDVNMVAPLGGMSPAGPIPKSKPFRVAGIFFSGMYEYDTRFVYVTTDAAQHFLGLDDEVTGLEIKVRSPAEATAVADALRARLAGRGLKIQDWKQVNFSLFTALKLEKFVMFVVLTFIIIVAAFSIVTNLIMVVLAKTREIAALKTMGTSHWSSLKIFFSTGIYIGVIGMILGVVTGVGLCLFLAYVGLPLDPEVYYISELPVLMNPFDISMVGVAGIFLSFLATIYPSILAYRLKPAEGLRRYET